LALALLATPALAQIPVVDGPQQKNSTPGMTTYAVKPPPPADQCIYENKSYSVGSLRGGFVCGYESDFIGRTPPDRSAGAIWRRPTRGEEDYIARHSDTEAR
jgi:hypothetical protein